MHWEKRINSENFSLSTIKQLARDWGEVSSRNIDDVILKPFIEKINFPENHGFLVLQTHIARNQSDQDGIDKLGGVLGAIEPRLEYGIDAVNEMKIALGIMTSSTRYYAEPRALRTNVYLTPVETPSNNHDLLSHPFGHLIVAPQIILDQLGESHQLIREDMVRGDTPLSAVSRLRQLSNQWRIAVI